VLPGHLHGHHLVNITDRWQEIREALGFPEVRIHDLRHTVASVLAKSAPLIVVRDALGHSEIGTTSDYSHAANEDVRLAVDVLATAIAGGNEWAENEKIIAAAFHLVR
jgi:integrase